MNLLIVLVLAAAPAFYRAPLAAGDAPAADGPAWVLFTDKAVQTDAGYRSALAAVAAAATPQRRVRRAGSLLGGFDFSDLPVRPEYVRAVEALGGRLRATSDWLNAASFDLPAVALPAVRALPFVHDVRPVVCEQRTVTDEVFPLARPRSVRSSAVDSAEAHRFYGPS
ncbi:hypothetical protein JXB37_06635, partial [candidate division WOR-3 bacterium]|nr:hypothetical protein [candidate division WOR-3 bacterium]